MSHRGKKKEKRPLTDSDSDSGPDDRGPAPKGAKKDSNPYKKAETSRPVSKSSRGEEDPSWDLGKNKWVKVREFKGQTYIDIREYYVDKDTMETKPGKKGISLNCQQYQKLKVKSEERNVQNGFLIFFFQFQSIIDEIDHELP